MIQCNRKNKDKFADGRSYISDMKRRIKVAVCGELPTACDFLLHHGVVNIDKYLDATEIRRETDYHLILIYAPNAEGLLNTQYSRGDLHDTVKHPIPIRLLGEPCCKSALIELKSTIRRIEHFLSENPSVLNLDKEIQS